MATRKSDIVTFKVDPALLIRMKGIPNRSNFIRSAILNALDSTCPLCQGSGIFTPKQQEHWDDFRQSHVVKECDDCNELHLVCTMGSKKGRSS